MSRVPESMRLFGAVCVYLHRKTHIIMKKYLISLLAALFVAAASYAAPDNLRYSYRYNGYTHISSELSSVAGDSHPFSFRLEKIAYPDNTYIYQLKMYFEDRAPFSIPKGARMSFTTPESKVVRVDQIEKSNEPILFERSSQKLYWNPATYIIPEDDLLQVIGGIASVEVVTGWEIDDYFQIQFKSNDFAKALNAQYETVRDAELPAYDVDVEDIARYADNATSLTVLSRAKVATGKERIYNVALNYLYYKTSNTEDFDLNFMIGTEQKYTIPVGSEITITLADGSSIILPQERDQVNVVYLYPDMEQLKAILRGVKAISIDTPDGTINDTFPDDSFAATLQHQYNTLMILSVL